jgi:magnesium-dependent phosphatase 1
MELFVFDLDFTLWNAGDTFCSETKPPYIWKNSMLFDSEGRWIRLYPDTLKVLEFLYNKNKIIAIASRTYQPLYAQELLNLFDLNRYLTHKEIYPGEKTIHLKKIQLRFNIPYNNIVFFDDEIRNIRDVERLNIKGVLVSNGIKFDTVTRILK